MNELTFELVMLSMCLCTLVDSWCVSAKGGWAFELRESVCVFSRNKVKKR